MNCDFPHQLFCKHSNCFEHFPLVRLYNIEATGHKQALFSFPSPLVDHPQLASFSAPHIPLTYHSFSSLKLPRFSTVSVSNMAAFSFYYTMSVHLSGYQWLQLASWRPVCQVKRNPWALSFLVRHFRQSQWSTSQRFNSFSQSSEWCSVEIGWPSASLVSFPTTLSSSSSSSSSSNRPRFYPLLTQPLSTPCLGAGLKSTEKSTKMISSCMILKGCVFVHWMISCGHKYLQISQWHSLIFSQSNWLALCLDSAWNVLFLPSTFSNITISFSPPKRAASQLIDINII